VKAGRQNWQARHGGFESVTSRTDLNPKMNAGHTFARRTRNEQVEIRSVESGGCGAGPGPPYKFCILL